MAWDLPELPEVETIVRALQHPSDWSLQPEGGLALQPGIVGRRILSATVLWDRTVAFPGIDVFAQQVKGLQIEGVSRRGKFIQIEMPPKHLLIHLRMSGDLRVEAVNQPVGTHDRLILSFDDGIRLVFNDTRKFGRAWLVDDPGVITGSLGPDPFDENLTPAAFSWMLKRSRKRIKSLLLDQTFLAGMGNIYSDEALFRAGIHPMSPAASISEEKVEILLNSIRIVLNEGIDRNGASIDWVYRGGTFQNYFYVYQRTGQPCLKCSTPIERVLVGQRGTHYCPHCQV